MRTQLYLERSGTELGGAGDQSRRFETIQSLTESVGSGFGALHLQSDD
jgi:hypothetical protein